MKKKEHLLKYFFFFKKGTSILIYLLEMTMTYMNMTTSMNCLILLPSLTSHDFFFFQFTLFESYKKPTIKRNKQHSPLKH